MNEPLKGKKTIIGAIAGAILSMVVLADSIIAPDTWWLTSEQYAAISGMILSWFGVSVRLAIKKGR